MKRVPSLIIMILAAASAFGISVNKPFSGLPYIAEGDAEMVKADIRYHEGRIKAEYSFTTENSGESAIAFPVLGPVEFPGSFFEEPEILTDDGKIEKIGRLFDFRIYLGSRELEYKIEKIIPPENLKYEFEFAFVVQINIPQDRSFIISTDYRQRYSVNSSLSAFEPFDFAILYSLKTGWAYKNPEILITMKFDVVPGDDEDSRGSDGEIEVVTHYGMISDPAPAKEETSEGSTVQSWKFEKTFPLKNLYGGYVMQDIDTPLQR